MPSRHTVEQGEHLSRIAVQYGFSDIAPIWDHPDNADLKNLRKNPNVLAPGDEVVIPDKVEKVHHAQTGQSLRFQIKLPKLKIRFKLLDLFGQPLANTECELALAGMSETLTSDGDGMIEKEVSASAELGRLKVGETEWEIRIGHLDPIEEPSGLRARLNNLGYYVGEGDDEGVDPEQLRFAIELFQRDNDLPIDGEVSQDLIDKVRTAHGC
ncbi:MAG TPA: peptidoglycan-binding protein [Polyangia bacterium]|nr:peptidoglycan-binding protein [Polyangia bacterium]